MRTAALLGLLGFGPEARRFLVTADADERLLLTGLCDVALGELRLIQRSQAVEIVNALAKAIK